MRKYLLIVIPLLLLDVLPAVAQTITPLPADSIRRRIIFIGDAGELDKQQQAVIPDAASHILAGKTTVVYLGDNIYPSGMGLPGSSDEKETQQILQSQYQPMRSKGATVYFIPGNHDWDRMGKNGLAKIKRQWEFLNEQDDSLLQLVPGNGCPGPVEINIDDSLVIIAFDSEWWLFPFNKTNPDAECDCNNRDEIIAKFEELFYKNRYKVIVLASHHPFQSYGVHGGHFSWKDHLFPLTAANSNLYIPLPVIGSLYPILRRTFTNPEDLRHPLYRDMIKKIDKVFDSFPNLVHVAGHEHGLQLIKSDQLQVISGAGAKKTSAGSGKYTLFANATQGYVTMDLLPSNNTRFTYYMYKEGIVQPVFSYTEPYHDVKTEEEAAYTAITADSIEIKAYAPYNNVSGFHKSLFGGNYRKEWAAETKLPVLKISTLEGGLKPLKRGGGHQTYSLRLEDKSGNEWVLRSIEKYPDVLLPEALRGTFANDIIKDVISAQHPYSALVVPVLANAVKVPHANPVIGYVAPDKQLGIYEKVFANRVCLFEEREPLGNSDNTAKMLEKLNADNDNSVDSSSFLRARLLDLFLGDWDRHEDQWRWVDTKKGNAKRYLAIPRDRDQALYKNKGFIPSIASMKSIAPFLKGFQSKIIHGNGFFINGRNLDGRILNQFDQEQWMNITHDFLAALTDSVLDASLKKLPTSSYKIGYAELFDKMRKRRENMAVASEDYYRFLSKIVDIRLSDKNELAEITDAPDGGLTLTIHKISKEGKIKELLYARTFSSSVTKEIRIFEGMGNDSIVVNTKQHAIKLRIVGGDGHKIYNILDAGKKVQVYAKESNTVFEGETGRIRKHISDDTSNTRILPTNRYNVTMPLITAGYNLDDGLLLGLSLKHTQQGFRKTPYASVQQLSFLHSFSTHAFRFGYKGEWIKAIGPADFLLNVIAKAPDNTQNFFGRGNETVFDQTGDYKRFYRARFALFEINPALRWKGDKGASFSIGPSYQLYQYDTDDNVGRFTTHSSLIGSYDSSTITKDKSHLGVVMNFTNDKRNNKIFPTWGSYINIRMQGYAGVNGYSKSFAQIIPEIAVYKSLNAAQTMIVAERFGGGISVGKTAFYQSLFLGGQENLLGYRQYRFAGQHSFYNNLELRIKLGDFASYILPGQFGLTGFFDIGRVWEKDDNSGEWHHGVGGGFYFAPAQLVVLQLVAGYSKEGWYPYFTMGFRF